MDTKDIEFLRNVKDFEVVSEGYSGAQKYLFSKDGKRYFIKIGPFEIRQDLEKMLCDAEITHPKIVEKGKYDEENNYVIEEFVGGRPLKYLIDDMEPKFVYEYGFLMGEKFRNLRKVFKDKRVSKKAFQELSDHVDRRLKRLDECILKNKSRLTKSQIKFFEYIKNYLSKNKNIIKNSTMVFGHNDIKPSNFLVEKRNICAIDIEGIDYKIPAMALLWSFARGDMKDDKNHAFANGWLDGLFNFDVPKSVLKPLNYVYLFNMSNYFAGYIKENEFDKLEKLINYITKNYIENGEICVDKKILSVAKIGDFKMLKGYDFSLARGSYSPDNLTFKCVGEKTYFLKVMKKSKEEFLQTLKFYDVLEKNGIPIPRVQKSGMCRGLDRAFVLMDYINYPEIGKQEKSEVSVENLGHQVAQYLKKIRNVKIKNIKVFSSSEIEKEVMRLAKKFFEGEEKQPCLKWTKSEIIAFHKKLIKSFDGEEICLVHDDVKCGNVLFDGKSRLVFVDNESLMQSYQTINFQYMIKECFEHEKVKVFQDFVRGYLKDIYGNVPSRVEGQIRYLILLKLLRDCAGTNDKLAGSTRIESMSKIFEKYVERGEAIEWLK